MTPAGAESTTHPTTTKEVSTMKTGAPAMTRIKAPRPGPRVAGVPRWIRWAAWASVLAPVPSGAWRLALAAGAPLGFSADRLRGIGVPGWASLYVVGLSVVSVGLACLALGLIFFFNDAATPEIYTLSLHDALPI